MQLEKIDRERQIIRMFRRGETSAMDVLYAEYADYLNAVCLRYISDGNTVKDVLQESFIKIFENVGSFEYRGKGSLKAWISRLVINESLQQIRRKAAAKGMVVDTDMTGYPDSAPVVADISEETIMEMIRELPPGCRAVFNLYVIDGCSHKEIGEMLDIKPDTSASQYHKAKAILARKIREYKSRQR